MQICLAFKNNISSKEIKQKFEIFEKKVDMGNFVCLTSPLSSVFSVTQWWKILCAALLSIILRLWRRNISLEMRKQGFIPRKNRKKNLAKGTQRKMRKKTSVKLRALRASVVKTRNKGLKRFYRL